MSLTSSKNWPILLVVKILLGKALGVISPVFNVDKPPFRRGITSVAIACRDNARVATVDRNAGCSGVEFFLVKVGVAAFLVIPFLLARGRTSPVVRFSKLVFSSFSDDTFSIVVVVM